MSVSIWQATLFGIFACLASLPGMGGTVVGNYTLGRPLVGGLICGLIMGDVATGIIAGSSNPDRIYRTDHARWSSCSGCKSDFLYWGTAVNHCDHKHRTYRSQSYIYGNSSWINSRNSWYSFNVWNSNDEPDLAGIWMEVSGIRKIKEIICS